MESVASYGVVQGRSPLIINSIWVQSTLEKRACLNVSICVHSPESEALLYAKLNLLHASGSKRILKNLVKFIGYVNDEFKV